MRLSYVYAVQIDGNTTYEIETNSDWNSRNKKWYFVQYNNDPRENDSKSHCFTTGLHPESKSWSSGVSFSLKCSQWFDSMKSTAQKASVKALFYSVSYV